MTLHFGERVPGDGAIRCRRCGHGIDLRPGDSVPRCYCGSDEFELGRIIPEQSRRAWPSPRATSTAPTVGDPDDRRR
jgi:hypothetical protein